MKKTFIIPYYGKWPSWFPCFLYTCSLNKDTDFIFFTDIAVPANKPGNVIFYPYTFEQIVELATQKLGVRVLLDQPYKLCDLKPMYGKIFEDYITGSDYWGHLDIDVLLGNLEAFLNAAIIQGYDIISSRKDMVNGSLALYKNTGFVNALYTYIPFVMEMVNDSKSHYLDEFYFTRTLQMFERNGKIRMLFREITEEDALNEARGKKAWAILFSGGRAVDVVSKHDVAYIHFIHSKSRPVFKSSFPDAVADAFLLTEKGYVAYSATNFYKALFICYRKNFMYYLKRFIKKRLNKMR